MSKEMVDGFGKSIKGVCDYIRGSLADFNENFVNAVVDTFLFMHKNQESGTCLTISVQLAVIAQYYGYDAKLVYGLCKYQDIDFYHAWIEIDNKIIDVAIYGNVNWSGLGFGLDKPVIYESYEDVDIHYGKFEFDETWFDSDLYEAEGWTVEKYLNTGKYHCLWYLLLNRIGSKETSYEDLERILCLIKSIRIEVPVEYGHNRDNFNPMHLYNVMGLTGLGTYECFAVCTTYEKAYAAKTSLESCGFDVELKQSLLPINTVVTHSGYMSL